MNKEITEVIREDYERTTGKRWLTNPVCHGELGFASWEYQLWLETQLFEIKQSYIQLENSWNAINDVFSKMKDIVDSIHKGDRQ